MIGSFYFYRPRRLLPFSAAYALVFINGATLVPFVPPAPIGSCSSGSGCSADSADPRPSDDSERWMHYERGSGEELPPDVAAGPPPLVKNLRRVGPAGSSGASSSHKVGRLTDSPVPSPEFLQHALVANAANLSRLCRWLL